MSLQNTYYAKFKTWGEPRFLRCFPARPGPTTPTTPTAPGPGPGPHPWFCPESEAHEPPDPRATAATLRHNYQHPTPAAAPGEDTMVRDLADYDRAFGLGQVSQP